MGESYRVIVVDDEPDYVEGLRDHLEGGQSDVNVDAVRTCTQAISRLESSDVDCIVSDYELPDSTGLEFLEAVREKVGDVPFILNTASGSERIASEAISAGVTDYVQKGDRRAHYSILANRIERVIAERQARERDEARQRQVERLIDNLPGVVYQCRNEPSWPIESIEGDCRRLTGYPCEAFESQQVSLGDDLIHPDDRKEVWNHVQGALEREEPYEQTFRIVTADGQEKWVWERGRGITADGRLGRLEGFLTDVTEKQHREQELERARERYQSLFENNPLVLWENDYSAAIDYAKALVDDPRDLQSYLEDHPEELYELARRTEVIDVNQNAVDYYRADSKSHLKENLDHVMTEEAHQVNKDLWQALLTGERSFRAETKSRMLDGTIKDEIIQAYVPGADEGDFSRVYITGTDITERKEREREIARQNDRLEEFTSVVSHDLRNPLNVAVGNLALAREECDSEYLDTVARSHERMSELIDDLLDFATTGQPVAELEPVDVRSLVFTCWQNVSTPDAELVVDFSGEILAAPQRLKQLFENLFRNAVEHGEPPVTVFVGELDGSGFYVEDDGPGIPVTNRDAIFERGYSTAEAGTGFGLAIVKGIVDAHGWEISVTSSTRGGARFDITNVDSVS